MDLFDAGNRINVQLCAAFCQRFESLTPESQYKVLKTVSQKEIAKLSKGTFQFSIESATRIFHVMDLNISFSMIEDMKKSIVDE